MSTADWQTVLGPIRRDHILAFIKKLNDRQKTEGRRRALMRARRQIIRRRRAEKRASRTAAQMHKKKLQDLRRLGIQEGETAREAFKRKDRERRTKRAEKRKQRALRKQREGLYPGN